MPPRMRSSSSGSVHMPVPDFLPSHIPWFLTYAFILISLYLALSSFIYSYFYQSHLFIYSSLFQCNRTGKTDSDAGRFPPFPDSFNTPVTLFHFSVLVKMDHVFRADLFAGMTSNTFFFVCQYKSSLRIFVNCLHRTGFDTDTAVTQPGQIFFSNLIFTTFLTVLMALCIYIFHIMVCTDRLCDRHNSRHIYQIKF